MKIYFQLTANILVLKIFQKEIGRNCTLLVNVEISWISCALALGMARTTKGTAISSQTASANEHISVVRKYATKSTQKIEHSLPTVCYGTYFKVIKCLHRIQCSNNILYVNVIILSMIIKACSYQCRYTNAYSDADKWHSIELGSLT